MGKLEVVACGSCGLREMTPLAPAQAEIDRLEGLLAAHKGISDGKTVIIQQLKARALSAEAALSTEVDHHAYTARALGQAEERVRVLSEALGGARHTFDAYDSPLTTDRHVAGSARQAVKRIDAALAVAPPPPDESRPSVEDVAGVILDACCEMHIDIPIEEHEEIARRIIDRFSGRASDADW